MNAIDQLEKLVLTAEATARSEELNSKLEAAARTLREAEERHRASRERLTEVRERRTPQIEQARADEQRLKELSHKAARIKSLLEQEQVETLVIQAKRETQTLLTEATQELTDAQEAERIALEHLKAVTTDFQDTRTEYERLLPASDIAREGDDVLRRAEELFPSGRLRALEREVTTTSARFGSLSQNEQFYQMMIWIGRVRMLQGEALSEDEHRRARNLYGELVGLSRMHQPGYIEAFRQDYSADWRAYVDEAERRLSQLAESRLRQEEQRRVQDEERAAARQEASAAVERVRGVVATYHLPAEGVDELYEALRGLKGVAASDPELMELILPYRELLSESSEFRALRRHLQKLQDDRDGRDGPEIDNIAELLSVTAGKRAVMIGGARREEVRRQLEQLFQFRRLEWEDYERTQSAKLDSLEQSVKNGGVDLILILKGFVHHHVGEQLRPVCERNGVPCLMVNHGYGPAQIAQTLRQGLVSA